MVALSRYDNGAEFFDPESDASFTAQELVYSGQRFLLVTETGDEDGGQHLFEVEENSLAHVASDTIIDLETLFSPTISSFADRFNRNLSCQVSSKDDHELAHDMAKSLVGNYSSKSGPDGGNLACVWAVRRILKKALGRVVHKSDLTTTFENELDDCFPDDLPESDILPGGIVISPTTWKKVGSKIVRVGTGHVGILGEGSGESRLIYSNSSSKANWAQNFTVGSWYARYRDKKGLSVHFYPIPFYSLLSS